ncbi:MAG: hypothetical protein ACLTBB_03235 [Roseburia hominis]
METYRNEEQMKCLAKSEGCSVFRMENATGEGTIAMYELFPGVMLGFNDFHMDYFDSEFVPQKHVFCIDHCREGRMQYVADEDAYAYVEAGDLKLDRRLTHTGHFEFPLAHYHGAMICFDLGTADAGLAAVKVPCRAGHLPEILRGKISESAARTSDGRAYFRRTLCGSGADQNSVFQVKSDGTFAVSGGGGASPAH